MCAISINSYNWDSSESEGKRPKPTPLPHMRLLFNTARKIFYNFGGNRGIDYSIPRNLPFNL